MVYVWNNDAFVNTDESPSPEGDLCGLVDQFGPPDIVVIDGHDVVISSINVRRDVDGGFIAYVGYCDDCGGAVEVSDEVLDKIHDDLGGLKG